MLTIWKFARVLTAAVYSAWLGSKVRKEKFAKWWRHTLELYLVTTHTNVTTHTIRHYPYNTSLPIQYVTTHTIHHFGISVDSAFSPYLLAWTPRRFSARSHGPSRKRRLNSLAANAVQWRHHANFTLTVWFSNSTAPSAPLVVPYFIGLIRIRPKQIAFG